MIANLPSEHWNENLVTHRRVIKYEPWNIENPPSKLLQICHLTDSINSIFLPSAIYAVCSTQRYISLSASFSFISRFKLLFYCRPTRLNMRSSSPTRWHNGYYWLHFNIYNNRMFATDGELNLIFHLDICSLLHFHKMYPFNSMIQ